MRFDLRNPDFCGVPIAERYAAALDMAEWADQRGFLMAILSEHHGSPDGYLPSALPLAAAMAARTKNMRILIGALVSSFHDPLKLAEDAAVIDAISGGRFDLVVTNGYVASEFEMFGTPINKRAARTTELLQTLQQAFTGKPFEYRGRTVQVTPAPATPGGPQLQLGGSSEPAARRAARLGVGFMPSSEEIWELYRGREHRVRPPRPGSLPRRRHQLLPRDRGRRPRLGADRPLRAARGERVRRVDGRGRHRRARAATPRSRTSTS